MRCPNCASDNPDDSQFCSSCGKAITLPEVMPPPLDPDEQDSSFQAGNLDDGIPEPGSSTKSSSFCSRCHGAYKASDLSDHDGDLVCDLCIQKMEKRKSKSSAEGGLFAPVDHGPPPGEPVRPSSGSIMMAPPESMTPMKITLFTTIGVLLVGFAAAAVYFLILDKGDEPSKPTPLAEPEPLPEPVQPQNVKAKEPEPEPEEPKIPRSYEPRWFVGTFRGTSNEEGERLGALVFEEGEEQILVQAPAELQGYYTRGHRYRFRFKPTDKFYDHGVVRYYDLMSGIAEEK